MKWSKIIRRISLSRGDVGSLDKSQAGESTPKLRHEGSQCLVPIEECLSEREHYVVFCTTLLLGEASDSLAGNMCSLPRSQRQILGSKEICCSTANESEHSSHGGYSSASASTICPSATDSSGSPFYQSDGVDAYQSQGREDRRPTRDRNRRKSYAVEAVQGDVAVHMRLLTVADRESWPSVPRSDDCLVLAVLVPLSLYDCHECMKLKGAIEEAKAAYGPHLQVVVVPCYEGDQEDDLRDMGPEMVSSNIALWCDGLDAPDLSKGVGFPSQDTSQLLMHLSSLAARDSCISITEADMDDELRTTASDGQRLADDCSTITDPEAYDILQPRPSWSTGGSFSSLEAGASSARDKKARKVFRL